ncbi:hypothetical protein REPUB_Repub04eG0173700 [Reevesia pubescens]
MEGDEATKGSRRWWWWQVSKNEDDEVAKANSGRKRVAVGSALFEDSGLYIAFEVTS